VALYPGDGIGSEVLEAALPVLERACAPACRLETTRFPWGVDYHAHNGVVAPPGRVHADAACMDLVRRPEEFDVLVASNLFGDILTDLSAAVCGGLGLAPSANLDPGRRFPSLFEPVHGSAPDIAGRGIANPIAAILAGAMMLDWLREEAVAARVRRAVEAALAAGMATPDLGGALATTAMADAVSERLGTPE
jgi:tartrate dehydrogenase/decarboxylase/D-malate dehydrogenase